MRNVKAHNFFFEQASGVFLAFRLHLQFLPHLIPKGIYHEGVSAELVWGRGGTEYTCTHTLTEGWGAEVQDQTGSSLLLHGMRAKAFVAYLNQDTWTAKLKKGGGNSRYTVNTWVLDIIKVWGVCLQNDSLTSFLPTWIGLLDSYQM